jgi:hypothetical protein
VPCSCDFLRRTERKKNGKTHSYWNVAEKSNSASRGITRQKVISRGSSGRAAPTGPENDDGVRQSCHGCRRWWLDGHEQDGGHSPLIDEEGDRPRMISVVIDLAVSSAEGASP